MKPPTPHDALFRGTFSDVTHAAGLLRHLLRRSIPRMQWSTLRLCPGSFVDRSLRNRHSDLLFTVQCGDREAYLYLLLEHQSTSDPLMPFRLLVYMVRVWERHVREHPGVTRLPAIVPMVVHHSREGWTSPTSFPDSPTSTPWRWRRSRPSCRASGSSWTTCGWRPTRPCGRGR